MQHFVRVCSSNRTWVFQEHTHKIYTTSRKPLTTASALLCMGEMRFPYSAQRLTISLFWNAVLILCIISNYYYLHYYCTPRGVEDCWAKQSNYYSSCTSRALLDFWGGCSRNLCFDDLTKNVLAIGFELLHPSIVRLTGMNTTMELKLDQAVKSIQITATRSKLPVTPYCTTQRWTQAALFENKNKQTPSKKKTQTRKLFSL